ncbi:MAG: adenylate/guanylate cyclase domain-containing protein [Oligoflexus sp.]
MPVAHLPPKKPMMANYLATSLVAILISIFFASGLSQFITYKTIRPLEFKLRAWLQKEPQLDPRLKIYSFDDSTLRTIKDTDLSFSLWLDILEGIAAAKPEAIFIDKIFGITKGDFDSTAAQERLKQLNTRLVTGAFITPMELRSQAPLENDDPRFASQQWYPEASGDDNLPSWLKLKPGYVYGPDASIVAGLSHLGHLLYEGRGQIELFRRFGNQQLIPHWSLFAANQLAINEKGLQINSQQLHLHDGKVSINLLEPSKLRRHIYSMETVIYRAQDQKSFAGNIKEGQVVVILPTMYTGNTDMLETPLGILPGGYMMIAMLNSVLTGQWIENMGEALWIVVLFTLCGFIITFRLSQLWGFFFIAGGALVIAGSGLYSFVFHSWQLPWLLAEVSFIASGLVNLLIIAITRELHAKKISQALSGLVPGNQMKALLQNPQAMNFAPVGQVVSIMFIDIVGFSLTSKRLSPGAAFHELKDLLSEITSIIHRYEGTIDKTLGDGMLCFFGYNILGNKLENHADLAVTCAMEIQRHIFQRSIRAAEQNRPIHPLRIGINSASVYLGNIGNDERFDFTLVGDGVIFASRLETACAPFRIMIGPGTKSLLIDFSPQHPSMVKRFVMIKHTNELHEAWEVDPFYESHEDADTIEQLYWQYANIEMREERFLVPQAADLQLQSTTCRVILLNYSLSGIGLRCDKYLAEGVIFNLTFDTQNSRLFQQLNEWGLGLLTVEVCWGRKKQDSFEHGVRYIGLNEQQKTRIFALLDEHIKELLASHTDEEAAS